MPGRHNKTKTSHVSDKKISTTCCMIIPFASTDRYDPKEVFSYLGHVLEPHKKFFHATQTPNARLNGTTFGALESQNSLLNHRQH